MEMPIGRAFQEKDGSPDRSKKTANNLPKAVKITKT
jgi:hypothetical protein